MQRQAVTSSSAASVGYSPEEMTLEIEFRTGAVYRCYDIPAHVFAIFMSAESKGTFINANIRDLYRYRRV